MSMVIIDKEGFLSTPFFVFFFFFPPAPRGTFCNSLNCNDLERTLHVLRRDDAGPRFSPIRAIRPAASPERVAAQEAHAKAKGRKHQEVGGCEEHEEADGVHDFPEHHPHHGRYTEKLRRQDGKGEKMNTPDQKH